MLTDSPMVCPPGEYGAVSGMARQPWFKNPEAVCHVLSCGLGNLSDTRMLIVDINGPGVSVRQFKESTLRAFFSRIGHDLDDFTGPDGKWMPEKRFPATAVVGTPIIPREDFSPLDGSTIPPLSFSQRFPNERKAQIWILLGVGVLTVMGALLWRMKGG
jgi:hypothetical protein